MKMEKIIKIKMHLMLKLTWRSDTWARSSPIMGTTNKVNPNFYRKV